MRIPLWLKISYTLLVLVIVPVYWRDLGVTNFLWFSDIALIVLVPALWLENRVLVSTMAVAVFLLESLWILDFVAGGNLVQIAAYMFDPEEPTHIRALSGLFHFALPLVIFFTLGRLGYATRALPLQILVAAVVLPLTYVLTCPAKNINWVFGPAEPQSVLPPQVYLVLLFIVLIVCIYVPSHLLFKRIFRQH
ncbi:MAG: membrane-associated protein [Desulfuromonadaceae bacterium]